MINTKKMITISIFSILIILCSSILNAPLFTKRSLDNVESRAIILKNKDSKWAKETYNLINSGNVTDGYIDYSILLNQETSLDETWKAMNVFNQLNINYLSTATYKYLSSFKSENIMDKLKINSIFRMNKKPFRYNIDYDDELLKVINNSNIDDNEKIDQIFLFYKYIGKEKLNLSKSTINNLKLFLSQIQFSQNTHVGYHYDLIYLLIAHNMRINQLNKKYWANEMVNELNKKEKDLSTIYYVNEINYFLGNNYNKSVRNKISKLSSDNLNISNYSKNKDITLFSLYLNISIINRLNKNYPFDKIKIKNFVISQENHEFGGFLIRKINKSDVFSDILAATSLKALGIKNSNIPQKKIIGFICSSNSNNWRIKYYGLKLVKSQLDKNQIQLLKKNVINFLNTDFPFKEIIKNQDLNTLDEISYALSILQEIDKSKSKPLINKLSPNLKYVLKSFKNKSPVEISILINLQNKLSITIENRNDIINYLISFYKQKQNEFNYLGQSEMMINYYFVNALLALDYKFKKFNPEKLIFSFTDINKGGFNTIKQDFHTSSLLTTFYGIQCLIDLQNKK